MFTVRFTTKKGASGMFTTSGESKLLSKVKSLFAAKSTATVFRDNVVIGYVWEEGGKFNWSINLN